ncbi:hypothetical protein HELRODRAFT_169973 [Helobdella robusta]|uniref:Uncharacterized protein n=1 Tax=Helobdella robusta TaxID=6412 RepID=T1F2H8_HELRO|nr:hypothetical protein HELRODRAFT_169973 [Helobdella robusta]ESO08234.1 hypothetical protein HELRODRAFT_169973 [Helobdella robusta]
MSQANETKYGKISPHTHHHLPATTDSPSSKSNTKKREVVNHDCMDPMLKLDKLIESHQRCVQDDLRRKLMTLNDVFYMETEKQLTKEQKQEDDDDEGGDGGRVAGRIDELIDEVRCLSKNLDSLRGSCQSRKDEMSRIIEEQLLLDPNKNVALVIMPKLISVRKQHYEDLKVVCNNIHQHETRLAKVKMKVKVLEETLNSSSNINHNISDVKNNHNCNTTHDNKRCSAYTVSCISVIIVITDTIIIVNINHVLNIQSRHEIHVTLILSYH